MASQALIVIDVQNDYFAGGRYPLHQPEVTLAHTLSLMDQAKEKGIPIIHVQHLVSPSLGEGLFFYDDSQGAAIHPEILAAAPDAPIVIKRHADCFERTDLDAQLNALGVERIVLAGMMTHNCVAHTALSPAAARYQPTVVEPACCTVDAIGHALAVDSMQVRGIAMRDVSTAFDAQ